MLKPYFFPSITIIIINIGQNHGLGYLIFLFSPTPSVLCWEDL